MNVQGRKFLEPQPGSAYEETRNRNESMGFVASRTNDTMNAKPNFQIILQKMSRVAAMEGASAAAYRTNKVTGQRYPT